MNNTLSGVEYTREAVINKFKDSLGKERVVYPKYMLNKDCFIIVTKWLIETNLNLSDEDIANTWGTPFIKKYKLGPFVSNLFDYDIYKSIDAVYPGRFKQWQIKSVKFKHPTKEDLIAHIKYIIEDVYNLSKEEVPSIWSGRFIAKHKLIGSVRTHFNSSVFESIDAVYPGEYNVLDFKKMPSNLSTVNPEKVRCECKHLLEIELGLSKEDILSIWDNEFVNVSGIARLCGSHRISGLFEILDFIYPGQYKFWDMNNIPTKMWTKENLHERIRSLLTHDLKLSREDICTLWRQGFVTKHKLRNPIEKFYDNDIFEALMGAYPNKFSLSDFKASRVIKPRGVKWTLELFSDMVKNLIEKELKLDDEGIKSAWGHDFLCSNGLETPFKTFFGKRSYETLNYIYPNRFQPFELKSVPRGYWTTDTIIQACKWALEKEGLTLNDAEGSINRRFLCKHGLQSIVTHVYKGNGTRATEDILIAINKKTSKLITNI